MKEAHLIRIGQLQKEWNKALGITQGAYEDIKNYNPVLPRAQWEDLSKDQQKDFRQSELLNIETALRERNHTSESRLHWFIDEAGRMRNEFFLNKPYEAVLLRGIRYRKEQGSQEQEREQAELVGFWKMEAVFTDEKTPIGTKFVVVSPPGIIEGTVYPFNFVDIYELVEDAQTSERLIKYVRFASASSYEQYHTVAEKLDPDYFCDWEGPIDAWYLAHPIPVPSSYASVNADSVFTHFFEKDANSVEEAEFQELMAIYQPFALYFIDQLTAATFDPVQVAKAWNTLLHSTEHPTLKQQTKDQSLYIAPHTNYLDNRMYMFVDAMVKQYGKQEVRQIAAGCGKSGGFSFNDFELHDPIKEMLKNSVAQFGLEDTDQEWFICPKCDYHATGPIGDTCPGCGISKEKYAEETGKEVCDA